MSKEQYFIDCFENRQFIGDDAVILTNMNTCCVSQDAFLEGVHFKREWMSLDAIGRKAMLVNLSDAIAMNATPRYALITAALPHDLTRAELRALAAGLTETARAYGVRIVGGDTVANVKLDLSVTILADCPRPVRRDGLKAGDLLAYTGDPGAAHRDLMRLLRGGRPAADSPFFRPRLRARCFYAAAPFVRVAMDLSDGLYHDLARLHERNGLGFRFFHPLSRRLGCAGESYEMLFAFDPRHKARMLKIAERTRTPITIFARAERRPFFNPCRAHHF